MASTVVYATAEELRALPGVTGAGDDATIEMLLTAASRFVDGYCNRKQDGFVAEVLATPRLFVGRGEVTLNVDEMVALDAVRTRERGGIAWTMIDETSVLGYTGASATPNFSSTPYNGIMRLDLIAFPSGVDPTDHRRPSYPTVEVTANWGYAVTCPPQVNMATLIVASRLFKRGQSFWADAIAGDSFGSMNYRKVIDPDVEAMLNSARLRRTIYG